MTTYVPKSSRDDVYRFFFTEGVVSCKKDPLGTWKGTLGGKTFKLPTLQVMQLMRSLKSRGLIKEQFAWRHFYWTLNDEGINYMRKYLYLGADAVPNTHKVDHKTFEREGGRGRGRGDGRGRGRGFGRGRGEGRGFGRGRGEGRGRGFHSERDQYRAGAAAQGEDAAPVAAVE
ncbi:40S ribosomal protein S10, putative [Trypanosoma equiperdum]|nr:40S ribosomal protein S10, putative [Trypanosoma brucei gambiense DAL972]XP_822782.1 40S ribosomal protein S10, putative [Trypanosoma brucei brucei TREU927]4V8M_AD Chain AD, 40S RIBOSOMAL PROTEIN S10, PUTATIVE [Trypanosoma brucei brucei TREU927]8OVA_AD Chain AD, 40S ribosomal protein S10, putative [Trypanosoma brucei brucei]8OVE_AD Chain AD, 40S ribosomal protein S10, putative [Trypanosoma brucei brucei]RHW69270.1 40S ribosomal protein S10 [Trypanosoma brucei equiperdum]SCU65429.1 40S ribo|eukprot:XP_011777835.1 40S ribosomal protein S10, putative [Trypanosoma brucei gambiense DAL972]